MEKYINEQNRECYRGVKKNTPFTELEFHIVPNQPDGNTQFALGAQKEEISGGCGMNKNWVGGNWQHHLIISKIRQKDFVMLLKLFANSKHATRNVMTTGDEQWNWMS